MTEEDDLGVYRLCLPLGRGGMGEVWLAHHPTLERLEVVKTIRGALEVEESARRRFVREAQLIAQTAHPNLVRLYDFGEADDGKLFYSMEYICGVSLHHLMHEVRKSGEALDPDLALWTIAEAAAGLHHAHEMKQNGEPVDLVHRDVTPANLMLSWDGEVKVVDFGVARARTTTELTAAGSLVGKLRYMSPEQARGETVDRRCDVFALGAVLYEMVTGRYLHEELTPERIALFSPQALETTLQLMPPAPAVQRILLRALAPSAKDRITTAEELEKLAREAVGRIGPSDDRMRSALARCLSANFAERQETVRSRDLSLLAGTSITESDITQPALRSSISGDLFGTTNSADKWPDKEQRRRERRLKRKQRKRRTLLISAAMVVLSALAGFVVAGLQDEYKREQRSGSERAKPTKIRPGASALPVERTVEPARQTAKPSSSKRIKQVRQSTQKAKGTAPVQGWRAEFDQALAANRLERAGWLLIQASADNKVMQKRVDECLKEALTYWSPAMIQRCRKLVDKK